MSYYEIIEMPMSTVSYLYCTVQERNGVAIGYRRSSKQDKAILDKVREAMNG
jgi:hypothetical protein